MTMTHGYPAPTVSATARSTGRFAREMGYLLSGLPLGIAGFVVMVVGFAVGVSTLVIMVGLPVLIGTLSVARYLARVESQQIERVTGRLLPPLREREARGGWAALLDAQSWRDLLHAVVAFPVRIVTFCIALSWTVGGVGGLFYGLWSWFLPRDAGERRSAGPGPGNFRAGPRHRLQHHHRPHPAGDPDPRRTRPHRDADRAGPGPAEGRAAVSHAA